MLGLPAPPASKHAQVGQPCWTPIGVNFPKRLQTHIFSGFGTWRRDPILEHVLTIHLPHDLPKDIVFRTAGAAAHCGIFSQTDNTGTKAVANPLFSTQCSFALRSAHHVFLIDAQRAPGSFNTDANFLTRWKDTVGLPTKFQPKVGIEFSFQRFWNGHSQRLAYLRRFALKWCQTVKLNVEMGRILQTNKN